jgi:hypothetical protein
MPGREMQSLRCFPFHFCSKPIALDIARESRIQPRDGDDQDRTHHENEREERDYKSASSVAPNGAKESAILTQTTARPGVNKPDADAKRPKPTPTITSAISAQKSEVCRLFGRFTSSDQ